LDRSFHKFLSRTLATVVSNSTYPWCFGEPAHSISAN
jgi:hypothetical protein